MTTFRCNLLAGLALTTIAASAQHREPSRRDFEAMLRRPDAERQLAAFVRARRHQPGALAQTLLGAGFVRNRAQKDCQFLRFWVHLRAPQEAKVARVTICNNLVKSEIVYVGF